MDSKFMRNTVLLTSNLSGNTFAKGCRMDTEWVWEQVQNEYRTSTEWEWNGYGKVTDQKYGRGVL